MFSELLIQLSQLQTQSVEEALQNVLQSTLLILLIAGTLLLIVWALQFAVKLDALPQSLKAKPRRQSSSSASANAIQSGEVYIELEAQSYQSVSVRWTLPMTLSNSLQSDNQYQLLIRLLDATCVDLASQPPHAVYHYPCAWPQDAQVQVMGIAVGVGDRDYIAELGYQTADGQWHSLVRSRHVRVAAMQPQT